MDLSTHYLGIRLPHPIMAGSSPLSDELDTVRRLEDAGSAAIVLRSLFEEQISAEQEAEMLYQDANEDSFAEATSYFPSADTFVFGPDEYLNHLRKVKETVRIPVIASLNGSTPGGWVSYAGLMQDAGADALELNVFYTPLDAQKSSADIEHDAVALVHDVKTSVKIPVAVKLWPFYTSFAYFALQLDRMGADGLVLFNRMYEVDIDVQELEITRTLELSTSSELSLRLRGIAAIAPLVRASLAVTGGVHTALDVVKCTMAGAHAIQMVSAVLQNGPAHISSVLRDLKAWMHENEWASLAEMRGNMAVDKIPNPQAYARANYMNMLQG